MADNKKAHDVDTEQISARLKAATGSINRLSVDAKARKNVQKKTNIKTESISARAMEKQRKAEEQRVAALEKARRDDEARIEAEIKQQKREMRRIENERRAAREEAERSDEW